MVEGVSQNRIITYALYNLSASINHSSGNSALSNRGDLVSKWQKQNKIRTSIDAEVTSNGDAAAIDAYLGVQHNASE